MTVVAERAHEVGAAFSPSAIASTTTIKDRFAALWPPTLIVVGLVLTLIWCACLVWFLYLLT
jgi:hypothetical protein